jgi:TRAP transporter TAXI family solute receptor
MIQSYIALPRWGHCISDMEGNGAMFRILVASLSVVLFAASNLTANAAQFGTREEAVALVKRVQEKFKKAGPEATFAAVNAGQFNDRDLYPFIHTIDGTLHVANGAFPGIRGKNLHDMRDQDGKFTTQDFMRIATTPPYQAWSDFRWRNPKTGSIDEKSAWIERMGEYLIGVGIYKAEQQNLNTVSIISGSPGSDATYLQVAYDLAAVLNDGENLRVLPVVGIGGPQNIRDVRALKGIDVGLTQTSILNSFRRSNAVLGVPDDDKIAIVSKLFNLEAHLVVKAGSGITSLEQLRGQKVNLDEVGSGTNSSMRDVFQRLDIKIEEVNMVQSQALLKLKDGEIAATVLVAGKPADSMSRLTRADGLAFLPVPYSAALSADFLPAELTHEDYPEMIAEGQSIKTVADSAVLIAYNWQKNTDRYRRVEMFVNAFFSKIAEFQKSPHHPKWREVNLNSSLEGWKRLEPAQVWLDNHFNTTANDERARVQAQAQTQANDALFQEFLQWKRSRQQTR